MNRNRFALVSFSFVLVMAFAAAAWATNSAGTFEINGGYSKSSIEAASPFTTDSRSGGISFGAGYFASIAPKTSWGIEGSSDNLGSVDSTEGTDTFTSTITMVGVT